MKILIKAATVVDKSNPKLHLKKVDIAIEKGTITQIKSHIKDFIPDQIISHENLHISKGWFDSGISVGAPGYELRENFENGILTAAKSGFTSVLLNTNTKPVPDQQNAIGFIKNESEKSPIAVHPLGTLTKGAKGIALAELYDMKRQGALGFYDYKSAIENPNLLKIALQYAQSFEGLVFSFPQTNRITNHGVAHEGVTSTTLGLKGNPSLSEHLQIQRDIYLLKYTKGKLHIPTLSTKEGVALVKAAKKEGLDISCSVSLHHLWENETALLNFNTHYKVLPPLRPKSDQKALQKALLEGTIDFVTTDHNPIEVELKEVAFDHALEGSLGLEAAFGVLNTIYGTTDAIEILCRGRERFGLEVPEISVGAPVNLSLFETNTSYTQSTRDLFSTSKNSLYLGSKLKGKALGCLTHNHITF